VSALSRDTQTFFRVGDIVKEGVLLSTGINSPLVGVVTKVEIDYFIFDEDYLIVEEIGKRIQDRVTVYWFVEHYVETLPEDLLDLVSRNP
tara:strand:- start:237 stop:506 length:270 start_codon:yes stop_codon:yes gene_type:complete